MRIFKKRLFIRATALLLSLFCLIPCSLTITAEENPFSGEVAAYYDALKEQGFPADYAYALTELHLLHPTWSFTPLLITEEKPEYTWEYVLQRENYLEDEGEETESANNTIPKDDTYAAYRHPTNDRLYDSGKYQVSDAALAYFMDPRNFLNETDIFQFLDLSAYEGVSREAVDAALSGTFMETRLLENEKSFSEYFLEVGEALGVNPVFLAVKARQEQGVNGLSPVISGSCGTAIKQLLESDPTLGGYTEEELLALDGYYNLFNVKASGNGSPTIYYNAMSYAKNTGSESMREAWGSPAWDTLWKSLYGGAEYIKKNYVSDYVTTLYLQKFNVDGRAYGNFWKQYMQNVAGAFSEARSFYTSFASTGMLDSRCSFLIPVFDGMPESPSPDPAGGSCSLLLPASLKYHVTSKFTLPVSQSLENGILYHALTINRGDKIRLTGEILHTYDVDRIEYAWDGAPFETLCEGGMLDTSIPVQHSTASEHILLLRGIADYDPNNEAKKSNQAFLCAVFYVTVEAPEHLTVTLTTPEGETQTEVAFGNTLTLPDGQGKNFVGWLSSEGDLLPPKATVTPVKDISYRAIFLELSHLTGAALVFDGTHTRLRFSAAISSNALEALLGIAAIELYASTSQNGKSELKAPILSKKVTANEQKWQLLYVDSNEITAQNASLAHTAHFSAAITYSDGTRTAISCAPLDAEKITRSAKEVAYAALADTSITYPKDTLERLRALTEESST